MIKRITSEQVVNELRSYDKEKEWFEFKENWFSADELGEYISALANSAAIEGKKYAYFVWGVNDKTHEIVGTGFDFDQDINHEPLKHYLRRKCSPDINFDFKELQMERKRVVLLTIPAAKTVPVSYAKERYIRIGSSKENLRKYPEKEAYLFDVLRHGLPTLENTPSEYQDLTFEKLLIYYGAKGVKLNLDTFKKNFSFYTEDGKYNLLAQLLSDNSHMSIRAAIFSGKTKADNMYSVREFGNQCLLYSLDEVLRYGDVLNIIQADERDRVVERKEVPLFENDAFREAVINAFVHNLWVSGNEPMFTVFSDRIGDRVSKKEGNKGGNNNHEYGLNQTQVRILAEIRNNPNITKARLTELLGLGKTTIDRGVSVLKKYGYIERVGSRKAGYWKVHED